MDRQFNVKRLIWGQTGTMEEAKNNWNLTVRLRKAGLVMLAFIVFIAAGCSVEKNTLVSRTYHNVTARFNVYFNGRESFESGRDKIRRNFIDEYSEILPVFLYGDEEVISIAESDMDRTIEKCAKLISLHSITAKPEVKNNRELSPREREFYNRREYNMYVDDAYLLTGKAYFHKHNYDMAASVFRQLQNDFDDNPEVYESQVWMARIYNETGQFRSSAEIFSILENNADFPERLHSMLYSTIADYYLKQNSYTQAISYLERAAEREREKDIRTRYLFILAQLHEKTGNLERSSGYYEAVIRMNPPFEMAFHARINQALNFQEGSENAQEIEKELRKMLRDDKYNDYQDQVYHALGDFYLKEGDRVVALEHYERSVQLNTGNSRQKIRSYLTLADLYYEIPDYVHAQAYYDSTLSLVSPDYPEYNILVQKSGSLSTLVDYINIVAFEDSMQALARLDRQELEARIEAIIAREREQQQLEQERRAEEQLDRQFANQMAAQAARTIGETGGSGQWYFYNETAMSLGYNEFKLNWGNRKLEDHWQRGNKTTFTFEALNGMSDEADEEEESRPGQTAGRMSRSYYLETIPLTDSALTASHSRIEHALYNMGLLYKNELKDYERGSEAFKDLIRRYPGSGYIVSANYNLYSIAREQNNKALEELYKNTIVSEFPETMYAKVLSDPGYIDELERNRQQMEEYYEETYRHFENGNYSEVIRRADHALQNFTESGLLSRFAYLRILAQGSETDRKTFRDDLLALISEYPGTEVADDAGRVVGYLDRETPEFRAEEERIMAKELYTLNSETGHMFVFVTDRGMDVNQLIFNIINFNLDYFDNLNLRVDLVNLDARQSLIVVKPFPAQDDAVEYMATIRDDEGIWKDIPELELMPLVISEENYETLLEDGSLSRYVQFFNENYQ
ncbi:MAG: tetratricopeptide repeat protein [Bacteroidales bacterium]|nr:tetratricopeptide repeat protein [Bacteroidales bacterium]